ncbi:MAG: glycosyltransferase family 39 protein [Burkholderiales bacterium]
MSGGPARRALTGALLLLIALIWFANLDARSLIRPDEGRYAEIAREMAVTGDWVTPRLNGLKYFEKPPLQYWATAAAYRVFGLHEWTARLWAALCGALTLVVVWQSGRRQFGATAGDIAGLVATGSLWMVANAHLNTLDMGLTFWLTAGVAAFLQAQGAGLPPQRRRRWMALAWLACAGAVLSKGLVGLVLPGGAIAGYLLATRDRDLLARLHLPTGLAIVLAVCAPWFVAVSIANPEFPDFFFVREHFQRYLTPVHRRSESAWYFLPLLAAGALPWTVAAAQALWRPWRRDRADAFRPRLFLMCWCAFTFLFFSASSSKLPSYILPIFPALAWLVGDRLAGQSARPLTWQALPLVPLGLVAIALGIRAERYANERTPAILYQAYEPWIIAAAVTLVMAAVATIAWSRRERLLPAVASLSVGGLVAWQLVLTGHDALSPSFSAAHFAHEVRPALRGDCPLYSVRTYDQTLPVYLERTMTLVAFADEMAFGLEREPARGIPDFERFVQRWREPTCAFAFMETATLDEFRTAGLPFQVVGQDTRRVMVSRLPLATGSRR